MAWKFIKSSLSDRAANWISHAIRLRARHEVSKHLRRDPEFFMDAQILSNLVNERWMKRSFFADLLR